MNAGAVDGGRRDLFSFEETLGSIKTRLLLSPFERYECDAVQLDHHVESSEIADVLQCGEKGYVAELQRNRLA